MEQAIIMSTENYNFSYSVTQINLETGTFEVEYDPEDINLSPIKLNLGLLPKYYKEIVDANNEPIYSSQEEVPFEVHFQNTIDLCKPIGQWRNQYLMFNNIDKIENANGSFIFDTANNLTIWPTGYTVKILRTIPEQTTSE